MDKSSTVKEQVNGFIRQITLSMPFDKRHSDPKKNYGICGMHLRCILLKNKKAVQFIAYLPVYLPHVADELFAKGQIGSYNPFQGMGADVGYHSPYPMFREGLDAIWQKLEVRWLETFEFPPDLKKD